jgi:hypothetical protein
METIPRPCDGTSARPPPLPLWWRGSLRLDHWVHHWKPSPTVHGWELAKARARNPRPLRPPLAAAGVSLLGGRCGQRCATPACATNRHLSHGAGSLTCGSLLLAPSEDRSPCPHHMRCGGGAFFLRSCVLPIFAHGHLAGTAELPYLPSAGRHLSCRGALKPPPSLL